MGSDKENEALDKEVIMEDPTKIMKLAVKQAVKDELALISSQQDQEEKSRKLEYGDNFPFDEEDCPRTITPKRRFLDPIVFTPTPRLMTSQTPQSHLGIRDDNVTETWAEKSRLKKAGKRWKRQKNKW